MAFSSRAHAGSPTIAARCTTASTPCSGAGVGVANVGEEQFDALHAEPVRAATLAMQERVEHADVVRRREQLLGDQHADVAGPASDQGAPHALTLTREVDPAVLERTAFVVNDLVCANN